MYVSHSHRLVFLALAKNASRTVSSFLRENAGTERIEGHHGIIPVDGTENYLVLAIVRNPYARLVSRWWNHAQSHDNYISKSFSNYMKELEPTHSPTYNNYRFPIPQVEALAEAQKFFTNPIIVLRLENLNEEWSRLGLKGKLKELPNDRNRGESDYGRWQDYYSSDWMAKKAYKHYREDFESFGYDSIV